METTPLPAKHPNQSSLNACLHCGSAAPEGESFCCQGCDAAYRVITDQLNHYATYASQSENGEFSLTVSVQGMHCASCIQLIENTLYSNDIVTSARVNLSTQRLTLSWNGQKTDGDKLLKKINNLGYIIKPFMDESTDPSQHNETRHLLTCIAVSGFAAGNLMMISVGLWSSTPEIMGMATAAFLHWVSVLIALPAIIFSGRPFFSSAYNVLKQGHTNMDVPISLAIILASIMSLIETMNHGEYIYFDSAVMLIFFLLIGRYLDTRAKGKARQSAHMLLSMLHGNATILEDGTPATIPIRDIHTNMTALVATGENIPADGIITQGQSDIDMSLITGETLPKPITIGDQVFAGTINISGPIELKVTHATEHNVLSDIIKLMEKAQQSQSSYVRLADKAARLYTPVVHSIGLLTFMIWWLILGYHWQPSLLNAITVLIITCPCALGLAVPVVQILASGRLMKQGILLKSGDALEKLSKIDTIIFDKTGTLTVGRPELTNDQDVQKHLRLAASIASKSKHPLSLALSRAYDGQHLTIESTEEVPGKGLQATYNNQIIRLGSRSWCGNTNAQSSPGLELWLCENDNPPILFSFSDQLRSDAKDLVDHFKNQNITPIILSGDRAQTVETMAHAVGIDQYHAEFSPTEKCDYIKQLQHQGSNVLMVGDGLNDAPSLMVANISMSPSSAVDISQNTSDIVFQGDKLKPVFTSWKIARQTTKLVKQNFILAVLYNIIAIPLAMLGYVTPLLAAIAMSLSSLLVIANSFRLTIKGNA